ncbi:MULTISPECIES: methenyltetrahydromethanopterin cyclohydrolase [Rhodopirellula]|jgi:methenyltetrahydromethanopterin cyclohydrolase|uniref:methenyltetrahydromethanopterin cyclohydrolase n=1 Tax=Rhodopirellula TaxID=265488 RepID=UPI00257B651D|nr:methenyltetrahydromethanopterin cyclohydrolase [Rhodopirellula sp. UBA1907]MCR9208422.1 methenyltetrahydromethanopterin cyclohydrolase [bacterium]
MKSATPDDLPRTGVKPDLSRSASQCFESLWSRAIELRSVPLTIAGARVLDAGVTCSGSLEAGLGLARLCLGDLANVRYVPATADDLIGLSVAIRTDHPVLSCLGGQYAGWPVSVDDYFAMASGPMRCLRGKEAMLEELQLSRPANEGEFAVGVLESDKLPGDDVMEAIADECGVDPSRLCLAVAPSTSIAGSAQVVSRSVETALHKLHALEFDVTRVVSAHGDAPLPPPAKKGDTIGGIGRTNDAMLYGARVSLWVDAEDDAIESVAAKVPSESSEDHGRPFAEIFKEYEYDFYRVDPMLFSPAVVTIHSLQSGRTWRHGQISLDVMRKSFGL